MKPRIVFTDLKWLAAFERIKMLPKGAVLHARGQEFTFDHVYDDPHPPSVWLRHLVGGKMKMIGIRKGEALLCELA